MVDISSIPTDEYGIPKITPQEMVDVLNDLTHFEATTTAQNIHSSIDAKLHRIVNKPMSPTIQMKYSKRFQKGMLKSSC